MVLDAAVDGPLEPSVDAEADAPADGEADAEEAPPEEAPGPFYSFVWYAGAFEDNARVLRSLGADAVLAEGPVVRSRSIHWGRATRGADGAHDLANRNYAEVGWLLDAEAAGLEVVLSINSGQDGARGPTYTPWVTCGEPVCGFGGLVTADCPPAEAHWQDWYDFVFDTVRYFDGSAADRPAVRAFMSRTEAASPYWWGSKEALLGHVDPGEDERTSIQRVGADGARYADAVDKALGPVMHRAVQDANAHRMRPDASFVLGPPAVFFQLVELHEALENEGPDEIVNIARESGFFAHQSPACVPTSPDYEVAACAAEIASFFAARPYIRCNIEVAAHAIRMAEHYDHLSVRAGEGHPLNEHTGVRGFLRTLSYIASRLPAGKTVWDLGSVGTPAGLEGGALETYLARDMFQRLVSAYRIAEVGHVGPTWLYAPPDELPLSDQAICLYRKEAGRAWARRHPEAEAFALLARRVPSRAHIRSARSWRASEGAWLAWSPGDPLPLSSEALLFEIELRGGAHLAAGWCLDRSPWAAERFDGDCPALDLAAVLELPPGSSVARWTGEGRFEGVVQVEDALVQGLEVMPFLLAWGGQDADGDGLPDAADNCPDESNPEQTERADEGFESLAEGVRVIAPDGLGDACDPCPALSDPDQTPGSEAQSAGCLPDQ